MLNWYGVTHQPVGLPSMRNVRLNEQRNPYGRAGLPCRPLAYPGSQMDVSQGQHLHGLEAPGGQQAVRDSRH